MSNPSPRSSPPPSGQPYAQQPGGQQPYVQQPYVQQPYAQHPGVQPHGPQQPGPYPGQQPYGGPYPHGQQLPAGYVPAPRPEKPLRQAVWWSLVINLVVTVLLGLFVLLVGWFLVEMVTGLAQEEMTWTDAFGEDAAGPIVLVVAAALLGSLLLSWGLTVAALVLWRLIRGFRTIPTFVQALVAYTTMWVVTTVISFVLQIAFGAFGALSGTTTY